LTNIQKRLTGWQLESFKVSYKHKLENMVFLFLKKFNKMNKTTIITVIYILGIIVGAFFLDVWSAETSFVKTISVFLWTIIFLIALFHSDKHEKK